MSGFFAKKWERQFKAGARCKSAMLIVASVAMSAASMVAPQAARAQVAPVSSPPGASVPVKIEVSSSMKSSPYNVDRYLNVPPDFAVSLYARVGGARFMAVAPSGDVLVSVPGAGKIMRVRVGANGGDAVVSELLAGLRNPHDLVFHTIGATTYLYISESNQISRCVYDAGYTQLLNRQIVVANLPDASSPELGGAYGHQLKNIALDSNHKLYLAIASATNASPNDTTSDPVRCAVYQYDADGSNRRLFARGLRNAEGLAIVPGTNELWVTVNNRDQTAYPFHNDFDGDGLDDYGKVLPAYVDNHPPDEFTRVVLNGNYGWPFANPNPDSPSGMDNMPFDLDVQNNADGSRGASGSFTRINKGIQAHSAALGVSFLQDTLFPATYRNGAVIALHGSWNRTVKTGYKVVYFPWDATTNTPGAQIDLVTGWLDTATQSVWGRPVDVVPDLDGNLLISDDGSGSILKLKPTGAARMIGTGVASGSDLKTRALLNDTFRGATLRTLGSNGAPESSTSYGPYPGWTARSVAAGSDGKARVLWTSDDKRAALWRVGLDNNLEENLTFGAYAGWTAIDIGVGSDLKTRVLWTHQDGRIALWCLSATGAVETNDSYGPFPGWTARSLAVGSDNKFRVLWTNLDNRAAFWTLRADRSLEQNVTFGPYANWTPVGIAAGSDGKTRALWIHSDGRAALWTIAGSGALETNGTYGPYAGWTPRSIAVGSDNKTRVMWSNIDRRTAFWIVGANGSLEVNSTLNPPN